MKKPADKDQRPAPPLSVETVWDKGKWHFDAENFPAELPRSAGYAHILAALRFLDERGQLTQEGRDELAGALGDDIALLREHVKTGARAFLDQSYDGYLSAGKYGRDPPIALLEREWAAYIERYDPSRRPGANPYQKILIDHGPDLDDVLRRAGDDHELRGKLAVAVSFAPEADRPRVETTLGAMTGDLVTLARDHQHGEALLHALRYVRGRAADRLVAAGLLARRLAIDGNDTARLSSLAWAVNLFDEADQTAAWSALGREERRLLTGLVNALWESADDQHLALCAMRTVGDQRSLDLMEAQIPGNGEGTVIVGSGPERPAWDEIRDQVRASAKRRLSAG